MQPDFNEIFLKTITFINNTNKCIFLSGKAGTGKTTFLHSLSEQTYKKMVITASTGVAAVNAGGTTLHNFLQLPLVPFIPQNIKLFERIRFDPLKKKLLNELELLVIDEISMVRADILDAVDYVLRKTRKNSDLPFGGIQVLMIGDLYQLPPVTKSNEWSELEKSYDSAFFVDSIVYRESLPLYFELTKIYRQNETSFLDLLNKIRTDSCGNEDMEFLNSFYKDSENFEKDYINLTTHNARAEKINEENLNRLSGEYFCSEAKITGTFDKNLYPADEKLIVKTGAQVVLLKNNVVDKKYFNGRIGRILSVSKDMIEIDFGGNDILALNRETWTNLDYTYDDAKKKLSEVSLGSFTQFPIGLAWAITVHKSQGLTFEQAVLDLEDAFVPGQVYVALSRLRSLKGLILRSKISKKSLAHDPRILEFSNSIEDGVDLKIILEQEKLSFFKKNIIDFFNFEEIQSVVKSCSGYNHEMFNELIANIERLQTIASKFIQYITQLKLNLPEIESIYPRIISGSDFFVKEISSIMVQLSDYLKKQKTDALQKRYLPFVKNIILLLEQKNEYLGEAKTLVTYLNEGENFEKAIKQIRMKISNGSSKTLSRKILSVEPVGKTEDISLALFRNGKTTREIAKQRGLTVDTIESHLSLFISTGEISIHDLLEEEDLNAIIDLIKVNSGITLVGIKLKLKKQISYGKIGAVLEFYKKNY